MERYEVFTLLNQVLEAKAALAIAEQKYQRLFDRLQEELADKYPLER